MFDTQRAAACTVNFRPHDRAVALKRMQQVGAFLTTAEQVAFQLLVSAEDSRYVMILSRGIGICRALPGIIGPVRSLAWEAFSAPLGLEC